jgi:phenylpropionate dioxygenase-like ring-hydroxylating dioxygenase large terminal subunit
MTGSSQPSHALHSGDAGFVWPHEDTARVPYQVYTDPALYELEQQRLFQGPTWNFLCLEVEIPNGGDYKITNVGEAPVVVVRKNDGSISAVLNRCAHKGSVICYKPRGNVSEFNCVYHNWVYDLDGKLQGIAFRRGVGGKGGVSADFDQSQHNLKQLRVETYRGLIFGTFSDKTPPFRTYLGDELLCATYPGTRSSTATRDP